MPYFRRLTVLELKNGSLARTPCTGVEYCPHAAVDKNSVEYGVRLWCPEDLKVLASKAQALADQRAALAQAMANAMSMTEALPKEEMRPDKIYNLSAKVHWQSGLPVQDKYARARVNGFGRDIQWLKVTSHNLCSASAKMKRRIVLQHTLLCFENAGKQIHEKAMANLTRWSQREELLTSMNSVAVFRSDWGVVALSLTMQFGIQFAVLNMANAISPGGGYVEGAAAQEENMFRRSDCHFSIDRKMLYPNVGKYLPKWRDLISAEQDLVYLDDKPRVCVRGPEHPSRKDLGYRCR